MSNLLGKVLLGIKQAKDNILESTDFFDDAKASLSDAALTAKCVLGDTSDLVTLYTRKSVMEAELDKGYRQLGKLVVAEGLTPDNAVALDLMTKLMLKETAIQTLSEDINIIKNVLKEEVGVVSDDEGDFECPFDENGEPVSCEDCPCPCPCFDDEDAEDGWGCDCEDEDTWGCDCAEGFDWGKELQDRIKDKRLQDEKDTDEYIDNLLKRVSESRKMKKESEKPEKTEKTEKTDKTDKTEIKVDVKKSSKPKTSTHHHSNHKNRS